MLKTFEKHLGLWLVGGVGLLAILLVVANFNDLLGTRVLKPGSGRVNAVQGSIITLQLAPIKSARKVELCNEKSGSCSTLVANLVANKSSVAVTIPKNFPLGAAFVQSQLRTAKGGLLGLPPVKEKILLNITKFQTPTPAPVAGGGGGSGGGGGGGGGGSGGGGSSDGAGSVASVDYQLTQVCYFYNNSLTIGWKPIGAILKYRLSGETTWNSPYAYSYNDYNGERSVSVFTNALPENTNFEFYLYPGSGSPDGLPAQSQIYTFNSGLKPTTFTCRSLL